MKPYRKASGIKSAIGCIELPVRSSRHGRPIMGPDGPYIVPAVIKRTPTVINDPITGVQSIELVVKTLSPEHPMTLEEVQARRKQVRRALRPTTNYGKVNRPDPASPKRPKKED